MFSEAEQAILAKARETAETAAEVAKAEQESERRLAAQQQQWALMQQRAQADADAALQREHSLNQQASAVQEQVVQAQTQLATGAAEVALQATEAENERRKTLAIQAEVQRQMNAKEEEFRRREQLLKDQAHAVQMAQQECENKVALIAKQFEERLAQSQQQQLQDAKTASLEQKRCEDQRLQEAEDRRVAALTAAQEERQRRLEVEERLNQMVINVQVPMEVQTFPDVPEFPNLVEEPRATNAEEGSNLEKILAEQLRPMMQMISSVSQRVEEIENKKSAKAAPATPVSQVFSTHVGGPTAMHQCSSYREDSSSPSESGFSLTSSMQEGLRRAEAQQSNWRSSLGSPDPDGGGPALATISTGGRPKRELDEIKGIPAYPSNATEEAGWRRETRYVFSAASVVPKKALRVLVAAEAWTDDILKLPMEPELETLEVKFGKALRNIIKGDNKMELSNLEERALREQGKVLNGTEIYCWILRKFTRDARLARPQILEEIALVKLGRGKGALKLWISKWDAVVERLVGQGGSKEGDEEHLYIHFKKQFMTSHDLSDCISRVRTSPASSKVHSYRWMYDAVKARIESIRIEDQEKERLAGYADDAAHPMTPGLDADGKGGGKGKNNGGKGGKSDGIPAKPNRDTSKDPCPKLSKGHKCNFGDKCWYSHVQAVIDKEKKRLEKEKSKKSNDDGKSQRRKLPCKYFPLGTCHKGDKCTYEHSPSAAPAAPATSKENGADGVGTVALGMVRQENTSDSDEEEFGCVACGDEHFALPLLAEVPDEHLKNNHFPPLPKSCPICRRCSLTEAPAKSKPHPEGDERLPTDAFGESVDCDTLFYTKGKDGTVEETEVEAVARSKGLVFHDRSTKDVAYHPIKSRSTQEFKEAVVNFGGSRTGVTRIISDNAPEFIRGCKDLDVAHFLATPGRSTSHGTAERANRTVLERTRSPLLQSGLGLEWAQHATAHALVMRRLQVKNADGICIYEQKHGSAKKPPLWPFGASLDFKPTKDQMNDPKVAPRGKEGILIGFVMNPGGTWSGDFLCAELADFRADSGKSKVRIYQTKTATWAGDQRPRYPIFEAVENAKVAALAGASEAIDVAKEPLDEEIEEMLQMFEEDPGVVQNQEQKPEGQDVLQTQGHNVGAESVPSEEPEPPKEILDLFRLGGWFRRLPRIDPKDCKAPNARSLRPADIHTVVWAGCGQAAQEREMICRKAEAKGEGPPCLELEVMTKLSEDCQTQVVNAMQRAVAIGEKFLRSRSI